MANTVGPLIKEARTKAKLSQESLASQIDGLSASDLGRAERGEKELPQSVLRQIAKLTGVTQSSLINAAKESSYGTQKKTDTSAKKTGTSTKKTGSTAASPAKKTGSSSTKPASQSAKKTASKEPGLTAAEKKLVELYRAADSDTKKKAVAVLKGEAGDTGDILTALLGNAIDMFGKK